MEMRTFKDEVFRHAMLGYHPVIDTKTVLLMPGQYPCIPGWHCDGVLRPERGAQPDMDSVGERIYHYIFSMSGGSAPNIPTEFVCKDETLQVDEDNVWSSVAKGLQGYSRKTFKTEANSIYRFNRATLHRGLPATERTVRYFFRLSFTTCLA